MLLAYWRILFPEDHWETIKAESAKNGLDPYLWHRRSRQESEFNPSAISHANAYGLMQLILSVGKQMAREEAINGRLKRGMFDPVIAEHSLGVSLSAPDFDKFGRVPEYALELPHNAGDNRVADRQVSGPYNGVDEFAGGARFRLRRREGLRAGD